jgi:hypothetical protein
MDALRGMMVRCRLHKRMVEPAAAWIDRPLAKELRMFDVSLWIAQVLGGDLVGDLAERVANRGRMAVWQRVMDRLPTLRPAEARGYVRSRAAAVVQHETTRLIEQEGSSVGRLRTAIEAAAIEQLIRMITTQLEQRRKQGGSLKQAA